MEAEIVKEYIKMLLLQQCLSMELRSYIWLVTVTIFLIIVCVRYIWVFTLGLIHQVIVLPKHH